SSTERNRTLSWSSSWGSSSWEGEGSGLTAVASSAAVGEPSSSGASSWTGAVAEVSRSGSTSSEGSGTLNRSTAEAAEIRHSPRASPIGYLLRLRRRERLLDTEGDLRASA